MAAPLGVYIHVPFCRRRCDYCAFATYADRDHLMASYVDALRRDVRRAVEAGDLVPSSAVFFGGGTPSRLRPDDLCSVLELVPLAQGAEVSVECNPEDVSSDAMATYRSAGVTRISLGAQAKAPSLLLLLFREMRIMSTLPN